MQKCIGYSYSNNPLDFIFMKKTTSILFVVVLTLMIIGAFYLASILSEDDYFQNPYEQIEWQTVNYYDANLHTHTRFSDGSFDPHEVIDKYHDLGYHILALTDHDKHHIDDPRTLYPWTNFNDIYFEIKDKINPRYDETFGERVNEEWQNRDPELLGMLALEGSELSGGHHIGSYMNDYAGVSVDEHVMLSEVGDRDGLAMFFHPGRYDLEVDWYIDFYQTYPHLIGQEIYNQGDRYPMDRKKWDQILHQLMPDRPVWGFANDDTHVADHFGRYRNILLMSDLTIENFRLAMSEGHIYLFIPVVQGDRPDILIQTIETRDSRVELNLEGDFNEILWITHDPELNKSITISNGTKVDLDNVPSTATYVRAVILSDGGRTYTQPFGIVRR